MDETGSVAAAPSAQAGFLQGLVPVYVILGSFLVLTVPLSLFALLQPDLMHRLYVVPIYIWLLGVTHFVITLTIYLQSANLRFFESSWKNRILYFIAPLAIFLVFDLYSAFQVAVHLPVFDNIFRRCIRFFDFHHVTRQSYGVLQLLQGRTPTAFPAWMKRTQSYYFWSLTVTLLLTFWNGGTFNAEEPLLLVALGVAGVILLIILIGFALAWRRATNRQALVIPFCYLLLQTGSALLGVYSTSLWVFGLAMHYVEYHILMIPRCFDMPLDDTRRVDRFFNGLRSNKLLFYSCLLAASGVVTYLTWSAMGPLLVRGPSSGSVSYLLIISLFDGLFIFHYFIESLIWRFSDPYYRNSLGPLYFGTQSKNGRKGDTSNGT